MKTLFIALAIVIAAYLIFNYSTQNEPLKMPELEAPAQSISNNLVGDDQNIASESLISVSPSNADVFILEPGDGSTVSSPVTIKFGVANMSIAPAGENLENSGHHHLLLDLETLPDLSAPLPATENVIHFGKGQTETTIALEPGTHSLQLLLGNYLHIPHDKPVLSKKITIIVD